MKFLSPFFVFSALAILASSLLSIQGPSSSSSSPAAFVESTSSTPADWTLSYVSTDTTTIPASAYTGFKECLGLSTNNGNDGVCATDTKSFVKIGFAPFTIGAAATSNTVCFSPFVLESENLVGCSTGGAVLFFDLTTLTAHSTTPSISYTHESGFARTCGTFLITFQSQTIYKIDLTNLAGGAVQYDTSSDGVTGNFDRLATNSQGTRFVTVKSGTPKSLLLYDIPATASDPIGAHVDVQTFGTSAAHPIIVPGADDKNFKVYIFDQGSFDVFIINNAGIDSHTAITTEMTLFSYFSTTNYAVPNTNLLVVGATASAQVASVFVFDTSTDKITHTAVAVGSSILISMIPVKESDDTINFHIFTVSGTVKALAKFNKTQPSDVREPTLDPIAYYDWTLAHSSSNSISGFTGVEKCVKVSKNQNQGDAICSSNEKRFMRATLSPFTVTDESSDTTTCPVPFVHEPSSRVGCFSGSAVFTHNPFSFDTIYTKTVLTSSDYSSVSQTNRWFLSTDGDSKISKLDLVLGSFPSFDIKTANSLKPKQIVHNAEGTKAVVSVISSTTASDTSIALVDLPSGVTVAPTFITSQAVTGLTTPFEHLFARPGADADNFKVYGFAEGKMAVIDITGGNTIAITLHSTSTAHGDFPLAESGVFLPTPETATHLVLGGPKSSSDSDAALFVIDLSTNDYYKAPVSGCNSGSTFKSMVPMTKSSDEIDFHVFTSAGTEHCVFNFKGVPTPAPPTPVPTPAPTPAPPTPAPSTPSPPSGGNNQQNNNNDEATSSSRTKAVIASTAVVGGLGLIAVVSMIIYSSYFKNQDASSSDSEMSKKEGGNDNENDVRNAV